METPSKKGFSLAPVEPGFWLRWVLANVAGFGGAWALVMATVQDTLDWMHQIADYPSRVFLAVCYLAWAGFFLAAGVPGGILQWLMLRRRLSLAGSWIWRSIAGTVVCIPVSLIIAVLGYLFMMIWTLFYRFSPENTEIVDTAIGMGLVGAVTGYLEGAAFGILQWPALWRKLSQAESSIWIFGNALGGAVGSGLLAALAGARIAAHSYDKIYLGTTGQLVAGCAAGATFGVITGLALALASLLRQPAALESKLDESTRDKLLAVSASVVVMLVTTALVFGSDISLARILPRPVEQFQLHDMAWSPAGRQLASSWDDGLIIWDVETGEQLHTLESDNFVTGVAWSPDGARLAAALRDGGTIITWDAATGKEVRTLSGHGELVSGVAWSPDGTRLASGASLDSTIIIWDVETGGKLRTLTEDLGGTGGLEWSPDGTRLASGYAVGTIIIWDVETGKPLRALEHGGFVTNVVWSPDSTRLASGAWIWTGGATFDSAISIWDVETGGQLRILDGPSGALAWSPDGMRLASSGVIWDVETGGKLRTLDGPSGVLTWSPDGTRLASGYEDGTIIIWDVETGKQLRTLRRW